MKITLNRESAIPVYEQIATAIEQMVENGQLTAGTKLPSERKLAEDVGVHRNTVVRAYGELVSKGVITSSSVRPKGYFVGEIVRKDFSRRFFPLEKGLKYEYSREARDFNEIYYYGLDGEEAVNFGGIIMDSTVCPVEGLEGVVSRIFGQPKSAEAQTLIHETEVLKRNICGFLEERNMDVSPQNIQIVAETNQAISYLMLLYLRKGDHVVVEEPIIPDVLSIFLNHGIEVIPVPMREDGMDMEMLEASIRKYKPKFIYTMPNYHNPTGVTTSLEKRKRVLQLAEIYNVPIIEEDYLYDFKYDERYIPSLYLLDTNRLVVYLNSFTLSFPFAAKIGYLVGPEDLVDMLGRVLSLDETVIGSIGEYFLNEYMEKGLLRERIDNLKLHYMQKRDLMCSELEKISEKGIYFVKPGGGLTLWCSLRKGINERMFCRKLAERKVIVYPGRIFYLEKNDNGHIRLSYSNVSDEEIIEGIRIIGEVLDEME